MLTPFCTLFRYVHAGHKRTHGYNATGRMAGSTIVNGYHVLTESGSSETLMGDRKGGKGWRVMITGAITRDGALAQWDAAAPIAKGWVPPPHKKKRKRAPVGGGVPVGATGAADADAAAEPQPTAPPTGNYVDTAKLKKDTWQSPFNDEFDTAMWMFEANKQGKNKDTGLDLKDYHNSMDGPSFLNWVDKRLLPSFKAKYPGKQMVLVLDNASYHHSARKGGLNLALYNKAGPPNPKSNLEGDQRNLVDLAKEFECPEIRVLRNEAVHTFTVDSLHKRPNKAGTPGGGPTVEELRVGLKEWLLANKPSLLQTELQHKFEALGHRLLFTPPYSPKFQPIELFWRDSKNFAASQWTTSRTPVQVATDMMDFYYGADESRKLKRPCLRHGPEQAGKRVDKAIAECNLWIALNGCRLKGTLDATTTDALKYNAAEEYHDDGSILACPMSTQTEDAVEDDDADHDADDDEE